ncbi:hypothetical protein EDD22DRAFT_1032477 [Suillus occidentalis]|nr:hypothetical protein EDD22DRAFT_1032477 [Suillus occidentalis]
MTFVSNDPSWWPFINLDVFDSYWIVVTGVVVAYDWALTVGQEIELIWAKDWRCANSSYLTISVIVLAIMPLVSLTDAGCNILSYAINWTNVVMTAMLGGSRTMLLFLLIIFLAVNIACVVLAAIGVKYMVAGKFYLLSCRTQLIGQTPEETILSGVHMCGYSYEGDVQLSVSMVWMLNTVWEVLTLCLSVWIAVKHFRDLRRLGPLTGSTVRDCFRVLIESHVLYFASFASVSCFQLICLSPALSGTAAMIFAGTRAVLEVMQMFVLGPRLILSIREYHAKLIAGSDADTSMNSIVFQEHVHISTSGTV